jgi:hypothetical protein
MKTVHAVMKPAGPLPILLKPVVGSYPVQLFATISLEIYFNSILPSMTRNEKWCLPIRHCNRNGYACFVSSMRAKRFARLVVFLITLRTLNSLDFADYAIWLVPIQN